MAIHLSMRHVLPHSGGVPTPPKRLRRPSRNQLPRTDGEARRAVPRSTRSRILASSERLFAEKGFSQVSMPMIAQASRITAGAIYKHFDSKEALFFEVVGRAVEATPIPASDQEFDAARDLPRVVASYTTRQAKLLRQLAVEVHSASATHGKVRGLLKRSLEVRIAQLRTGILVAQQAGTLERSIDAELLACTIIVFSLGLMHMETVAPHFIGDGKWHAFVEERVAALLGVRGLN
jgi:AcrR family transcriptional regulator